MLSLSGALFLPLCSFSFFQRSFAGGAPAVIEGAARYLAYGVPDKDNASPPDAYPACRGWLPLEEDGAGYWMMYQDALTGEIVKK